MASNQKSKVIGYLRVSTNNQELEKNKSDILYLVNHLNLGRVNFVEEIVSGKISWKKRKITEVIEEFSEGDTLIVSELSRLGRIMLECIKILSFAVEKGVRVYAIKGNRSLNSSDSKQNRDEGVFDGIGNRTRFDLAANKRGYCATKRNRALNLADRPVRESQNSTDFARKSKPCWLTAQPSGSSLAGIKQPKRISATGLTKSVCRSNRRQIRKPEISMVLFCPLCQITQFQCYSHGFIGENDSRGFEYLARLPQEKEEFRGKRPKCEEDCAFVLSVNTDRFNCFAKGCALKGVG